jgi:hypothetical protein
MRKYWITVLVVMLIPGLLWSTEKPRTERRRAGAQTAPPDEAPESAREIRIFALRYQQADGLASIISALVPSHEATIAVDAASQSLIVATSPDRMQQIQRVIEQLDIPSDDDLDVPQMLYRIYMLELPSEHGDLKSFSMALEGTSQLTPAQLLGVAQDAEVQIDSFSQEPEDARWQKWELAIEGRAGSNDSLKRMLEGIPESRMTELRWNDEASTPLTTQPAPLPDGLSKHIRQLLGPDVQTVGYWFGNLSVPGTVRAPIGPWLFDMSVDRSTQANQVELEITVESDWQSGQTAWQILGNTVRSHISKPLIIGYNRLRSGTRTMGALVIVPQEDNLF